MEVHELGVVRKRSVHLRLVSRQSLVERHMSGAAAVLAKQVSLAHLNASPTTNLLLNDKLIGSDVDDLTKDIALLQRRTTTCQ